MPMINIYNSKKPQPGYLTCSGLGMEEKGIVQAQNNECSMQKLILDLLSHVCTACPRGGGILNGSSPLGECTDPNSDRVRCRCCPDGHLFLRNDTEI